MPFFKSMPDDAGPATVFARYPELYALWSEMSQIMMNGPSPLTAAERELILAYAAGVAGCAFVYRAHSEVAYDRGIEEGVLDSLINDLDKASIEPKLKPLLAFVRKLTLVPTKIVQSDVDAVFAAGWTEKALHDAISITARMSFMRCLVEGHGFTPWSKLTARAYAEKQVKLGYVNLYP